MAEQFEVKILVDLEVDNAAQSAVNQTLNQLRQGTTGLDGEINKVQNRLNGAQRSQKAFNAELSTTRYALYDVSSTLTMTGAALLGLSVATVGVAIAWERDFAQVVRTTGVTGDAVQELRGELVDLAQTMPLAFGDISEIATLAGQLGVAQDRVGSFTETVAKFSAVTDLSVEDSATAFGRLDALLPDVQGNYEALGSSIAKVGVESVATESQIVNITTQISSMASMAGLTADQVVGLSGALASVGAAPELSRGTITRVFTQMQKAISNGGKSLEGFAKIAGVSSDEFASAFGTEKFGPIFQKFIAGLDDTAKTGGNANKALADLGITSVRDVPLLLRLATAHDVLDQSMANAKKGMEEGTELNRQYGIISETTAAKLQVLSNNFMALLDAIGSANLGPLGDIIDGLSGFLGFLTDMASTEIGGGILGIVTVLTGLVGVLGIAGGAMALFGASSIGMQQALIGITTTAPKASAMILGTGTASAVASGEMKAATVSAKLLGTALKALSLVGILLVLPDAIGLVGDAIANLKYDLGGMEKTSDAAFSRLLDNTDSLIEKLGETDFTAGVTRALSGLSSDTVLQDLKLVDEEIANMANSGNIEGAREKFTQLQAAWEASGGSASMFKTAFTDANNALKDTGPSATQAASGAEVMQQALDGIQQEASATQEALDALRDAILNFGNTSISAEQASINLQRALNDMAAAAEADGASLGGTNAESLALKQSYIDTDKAARDAAIAMIENGSSADEATAAYMDQRQAIINSRIAKGEDAAAAEAWADKVLGSSGEAKAAIKAYSDEVNRVPATKNTTLTNNAQIAANHTAAYVSLLNQIPGYRETVINQVWRQTGAPRGEVGAAYNAAGGYITGPGTGTSDSIPSWLSNGEYVIKASAVDKYGVAMMNAINSGRMPKFAGGGSVGSVPQGATGGFGMGVTELGPKTMKSLAREVAVNVMLDDVSISRAAQRGDRKRRSMGDLN